MLVIQKLFISSQKLRFCGKRFNSTNTVMENRMKCRKKTHFASWLYAYTKLRIGGCHCIWHIPDKFCLALSQACSMLFVFLYPSFEEEGVYWFSSVCLSVGNQYFQSYFFRQPSITATWYGALARGTTCCLWKSSSPVIYILFHDLVNTPT